MGLGGRPPASDSGFSWDYVDLLGADGSGLVLIWAWGLPFVPGTVAADRSGRPVDPSQSPSLCLATYERGRCTAYVLQTYAPSDVEPGRFGRTLFGGRPGAMEIDLDLEIPGGERLRGAVRTEGVQVEVPRRGASAHRWAPKAIGTGRADLSCGDWRFHLDGRAYHDGNASALGLGSLGIRRWMWGRVPHPGGERIHYLIEPSAADRVPQHLVLDVGLDGAVASRFVEASGSGDARGRWGLRAPRELVVDGLRVQHTRALEDGPFYQRWQLLGEGPDGVLRPGVGEVVDVDRMDRGPMGPLVRMAVHHVGGRSSRWVPLFCGPTRGRVGRLVRAWSR